MENIRVFFSVGFSGTLNDGKTRYAYYSHTPKICEEYGKLTTRGSHYWEFLESPLIFLWLNCWFEGITQKSIQ